MKQTVGRNLTAGVQNTLFVVPNGYHCVVTMLRISNVGGSTAGVTAGWVHEGTTFIFQGLTVSGLSKGDSLTFGGPYGHFLLMRDGDSIVVTPDAGSSFTALVSFDMETFSASNILWP